jgi:uncharacterized membrane protein YuzA (DUF378 family)
MSHTPLTYTSLVLVILGALNWGLTAVYLNPLEKVSQLINVRLDKVVYMFIALAALILMSTKSLWVPAVGDAVMPGELIPLKEIKDPDYTITVMVSPMAKIAYWAAKPYGEKTPATIPLNFSTSGVTRADRQGIATLGIKKASGYYLENKYVPPNIHYRVINDQDGVLGPVKTITFVKK